jgi:hypothetical protein
MVVVVVFFIVVVSVVVVVVVVVWSSELFLRVHVWRNAREQLIDDVRHDAGVGRDGSVHRCVCISLLLIARRRSLCTPTPPPAIVPRIVDGVCLAAARLPVRQHGGVVPVEQAVNERPHAFLVDVLLRRCFVEGVVEGEWSAASNDLVAVVDVEKGADVVSALDRSEGATLCVVGVC